MKSPGTMLGYFKAPDLTTEMLDADGFLHTGDRGEIDEKGRLKITGRVKELFKTSKGKYVAPAPIENVLLAHHDVEQALRRRARGCRSRSAGRACRTRRARRTRGATSS